MYTIEISTTKTDEKGMERTVHIYEQTVDTLDIEAVIAVVNGLEKKAEEKG